MAKRGLIVVPAGNAEKATVGWFDELAKLISFLEANPVEEVKILHTVV